MFTFLLVLLLFLLVSRPSQQYASWLIESSSCHVELRDTTEVIMNAHIRQPPPQHIEEDSTNVFIQVFDLDAKLEVHVNTTIVHQDGLLRRIIYFKVDSTVERLTNIKYSLKLIAPPRLQGLQYVMDAITTTPDPPTEPTAAVVVPQQRVRGKFMRSPVVGCSGSRVYGRLGAEGHTFKLLIPPSAVVRENPERGVDVIAGWACGKEAVTLTHSIVFLPSIGVVDDVGEDEGAEDEL